MNEMVINEIINKKDFFEDLTDRYFELCTQNKIPGFSITVIDKETVIGSKTFGIKKIGSLESVNKDSLFAIGSVSKSFVALGILLLVQRGKLKLEDSVEIYLPIHFSSIYPPITIHHLLSHSSGINGLEIASIILNHLVPKEDTPILPIATWDDLFYYINKYPDELRFEPGKEFSYLNLGFSLLGRIIEVISEMSLYEFLKQNIFIPLNMTRTILREKEYLEDKNKTLGHIINKNKEIETVLNEFSIFKDPAGGIMLSTEDFEKYCKFYLQRGVINGKELIQSKYLDLMEQIHISIPLSYVDKAGYGYGMFKLEGFKGISFNQHPGGVKGGSALLFYSKELNLGLTLLFNGNFDFETPLFELLSEHIKNDSVISLPHIELNKRLNKYIGKYYSYDKSTVVTIERKGGYLEFESKGITFKGTLIREDNNDSGNFFIIMPNGEKSKVRVEFTDKNTYISVFEMKLKKA